MKAEEDALSVRELSVAVEGSAGEIILPVCGVSLAIPRGKTTALVGESGCGKSLTALAVSRLLPETASVEAGSALLAGRDIFRIPEREMRLVRGRRIGMIFQEPSTSLNPVMTVGDQMGEVLVRHAGLRGRAVREAAVAWLARVGIPEPETRVDSFPFELSGGQKQRCMIAMALAGNPELVIADEPTTALDVTLQAQVLDLLSSLQRETGMALLLITHDLAVVKRVADHVAIMYAGEIVEKGPAGEFFRHPAHPYSRQLLAAVPRAGTKGRRLVSIPGSVPPPGNRPAGCVFAPRCLWAKDECWSGRRSLRDIGGGRSSSCLFPPEEDGRAFPEPPASLPREFGETVLSLRDFRVWFPKGKKLFRGDADYVKAVDGVSLSLRASETLAVIGESGSGKTTLGRAVLGLIDNARISGEAIVCGEPAAGKTGRALRRSVQMIFQDPFSSLDPRMTVREIIEEPLSSLFPEMSGAERLERIRSLLRKVGLPAAALSRYPHEFSGGQRQRIAVARALAPRPRVVICDEPTSALDVSVQAQIINLLAEIQEESGIAYVLITHNFGVVEHIADRVAVMRSGKLVEEGSAEEVLRSPRHPYTKTLLRAVPRL